MDNNQDYTLFHEFIETYLPMGFNGINPNDPLMLELEGMMQKNNQFFFIADLIQMKILLTSKRSTEMIGIEPDIVTPYHFFDATHSEDIERHSLGRAKLFKLGQEFFIARKGNALLSTNLKILSVDGKYKNLLFQCYLFYSETSIKTVYVLQIHTNVDWYKKLKNWQHYYIGNDLSYFKYPNEKLLHIGNIYTKREFEIIHLIEQGLNTEQIAEKLFVSQNTVNAHRGNILKKSGKKNLSELIYDLIEQGKL